MRDISPFRTYSSVFKLLCIVLRPHRSVNPGVSCANGVCFELHASDFSHTRAFVVYAS